MVNKYIKKKKKKKKWEDSELLFKDYEEKNQTITFNVGGKKFEIDKGAINNYPNTLLYTIITAFCIEGIVNAVVPAEKRRNILKVVRIALFCILFFIS